MDKFYVKPKRSLKSSTNSTNASCSVARMVTRTSPEVYSATGNARASGVGKFYSKIRHTIEDNLTPKISGRLYKGGKHSKSMTALTSLDSSVGKYTLNKSSDSSENKTLSKDSSHPCAMDLPNSAISNYFTQHCSSSYIDSDEDEVQLSLNLVKTSLEDEIFEELEKVAHDEHKLNAVLQSFDKIMFDYNDPLPETKTTSDSAKDQKPTVESCVNTQNVALFTDEDRQVNTSYPTGNTITHKANEINQIEPQADQKDQTDCRHQHEWRTVSNNKLEKSSSSLSLTRRKCYQSPDSPCLRQMRHVFIQQQQKLKSKSVWELSNSTKIPILKAMPLQKRSKSFCYQQSNESPGKKIIKMETISKIASSANSEVAVGKPTLTSKKINRPTKYVNIKPATTDSKSQKADTKKPTLDTSPKLRQKSISKNRSSESHQTPQPRRTHSNANLSSKTRSPSSLSPPVPPRRSKTSDELLDKCLEKGQQILRKVESLKTHQRSPTSGNRKPIVRIKSNANNKISRDNSTLRRKKIQQKLNYANEDKILAPSLESCKIIPPDFAESSKKHADLLVNVVHLTNITRSKNPTRQMSVDSGIATNGHNSLDFMPPNVSPTPREHESEDSDDSGHISNENMEVTMNNQPSNSSLGNDIGLQDCQSPMMLTKTDSGESDLHLTRKPQRVCTTCRIAQVDSVKLIRTHVEIYPNFTKEVTIRIH
ncbi:uncharacterized protein LOC142219972 [Haematobia irritans]|uniref:uncharacterized protein LOC142219972 n=1 Tax=Haematobia irritans TaxID=7368 RepID=UPI003F4F8103